MSQYERQPHSDETQSSLLLTAFLQHPADGSLGIIEMLRSRLVALLRSSDCTRVIREYVRPPQKKTLKPFDTCRSDDKCMHVTDEHNEYGLRKPLQPLSF